MKFETRVEKALIKEGRKKIWLAEQLNMTRICLYNRLKRKYPFSEFEIAKIHELLPIN